MSASVEIVETQGVRKLVFGNGVARNLLSQPRDVDDMEFVHAVFDVVVQIRGSHPNANLRLADKYLGVGEFGLAVEEISAALHEQPEIRSVASSVLLDRAKSLLDQE